MVEVFAGALGGVGTGTAGKPPRPTDATIRDSHAATLPHGHKPLPARTTVEVTLLNSPPRY
ncbi:MAG TPA: hypothetical protein VJT31_26235 [Rugosimonospora sp.]|nr:hypothetical protein [Rugosimonospora sp.]